MESMVVDDLQKWVLSNTSSKVISVDSSKEWVKK